MDINSKYKDLWQNKEDTYRAIEIDRPVIIYMDGKNITNNHKGFTMLGEGNYTERLVECALEQVKEIGTDAIIYAGLDEVSVIFTSPSDIIPYFKVGDNANYICSIFMQKFVKKFWKYYNCYFKNTIYNINKEDIERYIQYRKEICYSGGLWYIAKEHLEKNLYKGLDLPEMEDLLKKHNLWNEFIKTEYIHKGYEVRYKKEDLSVLDLITL